MRVSSNRPGGTSGQTGGLSYSNDNFYAYAPGTTFKALVLDIQPSKVTIRLKGGTSFTARTTITPDARIGEESYFRVKVNNLDGLIQLEILKSSPEARQDNLVQEALQSANMSNVDENIEMGRALIENNLPLDADTLQKAAFFNHVQDDMDKTMFLLQEGFPADSNSVQALESVLKPENHLSHLLQNLEDMINNLPMPDLQHSLSEILAPARQLFMALDNGMNYTNLRETVQKMQKRISEADQVLQAMQEKLMQIRENLNFIQQVSQKLKYYQIPSKNPAELFVYPDNRNAVIGVDTAKLGRIEVQTLKDGNNLSLCFKGGNDAILSHLQANSSQLLRYLQEKGFNVTGLSYQKQDGRTTLLTQNYPQNSQQQPPEPNKRFAFDMRV